MLTRSGINWKLLFLIGLMLLWLGGCSSNPTETDARKVHNRGMALFKTNSFKKVNGWTKNTEQGTIYEIEYEAEIMAMNDSEVSDVKKKLNRDDIMFALYYVDQHLEKDMVLDNSLNTKSNKFKLKGSISFMKTEKGWKGEDGQIY